MLNAVVDFTLDAPHNFYEWSGCRLTTTRSIARLPARLNALG
jgi:hypothetical protein